MLSLDRGSRAHVGAWVRRLDGATSPGAAHPNPLGPYRFLALSWIIAHLQHDGLWTTDVLVGESASHGSPFGIRSIRDSWDATPLTKCDERARC